MNPDTALFDRLRDNVERIDIELDELRDYVRERDNAIRALARRVAALEESFARSGGQAERRAAAKAALEENPRRSNREIAKKTGVNEATVRRLRAALPQ